MLNIQIKEFSGPLDLLLQLIRREEMDIFDIDIHKITEQYLTFIEKSPITDLDSAGDFIRMAALLIYIKSKSLFPSEAPEDSKWENEEALQRTLTRSLLKMQAVQRLTDQLNQCSLLGRDVWSSRITEHDKEYFSRFSEPLPNRIKQQPLIRLLRAHFRVFQKDSSVSDQSSMLFQEPLPFLSDCIHAIHHRLIVGAELKMSSLTTRKKGNNFPQTIVAFLTLLELSRLGVVSLTQNKDFADIAISVKRQFSDKDFHFIQKLEAKNKRQKSFPTSAEQNATYK